MPRKSRKNRRNRRNRRITRFRRIRRNRTTRGGSDFTKYAEMAAAKYKELKQQGEEALQKGTQAIQAGLQEGKQASDKFKEIKQTMSTMTT